LHGRKEVRKTRRKETRGKTRLLLNGKERKRIQGCPEE
jgi:hypothetical protein